MGIGSGPRPGKPYLAGAPMLVAHRGGSGIVPENTMEAFRQAVDVWRADMLEMDVRVTRDGVPVVIHDETVDRTTDGSGRVADLTLAEIRTLDAGYRFRDPEGRAPYRERGVRIPTLDDVLAAFPGVWINLESKEAAAAGPLVEAVRRHEAEARVLVAAEYERWRRKARGYCGPWGASRHHVILFRVLSGLPWAAGYTPRVDVLQIPETWKGWRIVTRRLIAQAHRKNIPVQVWTVDDPAAMVRLLDWGVDGIQTDRPDVLARVLHERYGRPVAPGLEGEGQ
ncbi:MAG: glycerophosphodiester phosphodiesterase [Gemmatimonadota bacterium]|nr:glycerophosphodiester phosphodiesterase [Gemmatimonadota bacterium]